MKKASRFAWRCGAYPKKDVSLLLPALLGFLTFYLIPFIWSFHYAMSDSAFSQNFVGLKNFQETWNNTYYRIALSNSLVFAIALPLCILPLTLLLAMIMRRSAFARKLQKVFLFPAFMPASAIANVWLLIFAKGRTWMAALSLGGAMFHSGHAGEWLCVFTLALWKNIGIPLTLILGSLLTLDVEQEQAAALDGANAFQRFVHIVFPQIKANVLFVLVYLVMVSQRLFREAYVLYGSYPSESIYMVQHYMNNQFTKLNYPSLATGAILLTALIMILMAPLLFAFRHTQEEIG